MFFRINDSDLFFGKCHGPSGIIQLDNNGLGQKIPVSNSASSFSTFTAITAAGHILFHFHIAFVFILQTAFQSSAYTGNGRGCQRKILFFCHFHVDGGKILNIFVQKSFFSKKKQKSMLNYICLCAKLLRLINVYSWRTILWK